MRFPLKFVLSLLALLVLLTLLAAGLVALWPRTAAQALAGHLLQRSVSIAELEIGWGEPLRVRLRDLAVANMPNGTASHVITIAAIEAEIDRKALFEGRLVYRHLKVEKPVVVLERDAKGRGNWTFGDPHSSGGSHEADGLALIPKNRKQFPSLLDAKVTQGMVRYRTSSGTWLSIPLDDLAIAAQDEDAPVTLSLDGGYNAVDAQLQAMTGSFRSLRDAEQPFDAGFTIVTPGAKLDFKGVIAEPVDFEGVQGRLSIEAPKLDALLGLFGSALSLDAVPLRLSGAFSHAGEQWHLESLAGDLGGNAVEGSLALQEGARGKSDQIRAVLDFARLDLAALLATDKAGPGWREVKLQPPTAQDAAELDLQISVQRLAYDPWHASDVTLAALLAPGSLTIERLAANLADGELELKGALAAAERDAGKLTAELRLNHASADRLFAMLGLPQGQVAGALDLQSRFSGQGPTLGRAMATANGQSVIAMQEGRVARGLIELASADLRTLFRQKDEATALRCLLAVVDLKDGRGRMMPLLLRSANGTIRGAGSFSLAEKPQIDLLIRSDPQTTGAFALDIPIRLHGPLDGSSLKAEPLRNAALPELPMPALTGAMAKLAQQNPCWK